MDHLDYTRRHATTLATMPLIHRDPFDRMLIAQALTEDAVFVTLDAQCQQYEVEHLQA